MLPSAHTKTYQVEHICKAATLTSLTGWELSQEEVLLEQLQGEYFGQGCEWAWTRLSMTHEVIIGEDRA
jgi:hypothetical protein